MKITRLQITSYRGVAAFSADIPPAGAIVKGGNARGKTSIIKAIRAALAAQDVAADAIRIGEDRAEILVDLDDVSVRQVITPKASNLTVERGGMKASKPRTYLTELLGSSPLDPLDLFLAKPKERRAQILAALPAKVTVEQLRKYAPEIPNDFDVSGHGLEVVERARKFFYDERTAANKEADVAKREAERLAAEATKLAREVKPGPLVPAADAKSSLSDAERTLLGLEARHREALESAKRTAVEREKAQTLREKAESVIAANAGGPMPIEGLLGDLDVVDAKILDLEKQLAQARAERNEIQDKVVKAQAFNDQRETELTRARDMLDQSEAITQALGVAAIAAPTEEEFATARLEIAKMKEALERADAQAKVLEAAERERKAKALAKELAAEAEELDRVVKALANDAPSELLASTEGIPGLSLDGDEVMLDGKRLDALSGAEQMKFAVEIARRANAKTKILIVDGLERLDPDQLEVFVGLATRDGYQLIATRVDRGDVVVEAIEPEATAAAAE